MNSADFRRFIAFVAGPGIALLQGMGKMSIWIVALAVSISLSGVVRARGEEPAESTLKAPYIPTHLVYGEMNSSTQEGRTKLKESGIMMAPAISSRFNTVIALCQTNSTLAKKGAELMNGIRNYQLQVDFVVRENQEKRLQPEIRFQLVRIAAKDGQSVAMDPASKKIIPLPEHLLTFDELSAALEELREPLKKIYAAQQEEDQALKNIDHYTTDTTDRTGLKAI